MMDYADWDSARRKAESSPATVRRKKQELPPEEFLEFLRGEIESFSQIVKEQQKNGQPAETYTEDGWYETPASKTLRSLFGELVEFKEQHSIHLRGDPLDTEQGQEEEETSDYVILLLALANGDDASDFVSHISGFLPDEHDPAEFVDTLRNIYFYDSAIFRKVVESRNPSWEAGRLLRHWNAIGRIDLTALENKRLEWKARRDVRNRPMPEPSLIRNPRDAELVAVEWMRFWGFDDAKATPVGADEGIDVVSETAVAQVKAHMVPIGRPDLQNLAGVAAVEGKTALFFALNGYTAQAIQWADRAKMALFTFDLQGAPEPVNNIAREYQTGS